MRVRTMVIGMLTALAMGCAGGDAVPADPAGGVPTTGDPAPGEPGQRDPGGDLEEPGPTGAEPTEQPGIHTPEDDG